MLELKACLTNKKDFLDELTQLIQSNPHPRESKRALAVKMVMQVLDDTVNGGLRQSIGG